MDGESLGINLLLHRKPFERIHHIGNPDPGWTSHRTRIAGRAYPDCVAVEDRLDLASPYQGNRLAWRNVHGVAHRTRARAGTALNALSDLVSIGDEIELSQKRRTQLTLFP